MITLSVYESPKATKFLKEKAKHDELASAARTGKSWVLMFRRHSQLDAPTHFYHVSTRQEEVRRRFGLYPKRSHTSEMSLNTDVP